MRFQEHAKFQVELTRLREKYDRMHKSLVEKSFDNAGAMCEEAMSTAEVACGQSLNESVRLFCYVLLKVNDGA